MKKIQNKIYNILHYSYTPIQITGSNSDKLDKFSKELTEKNNSLEIMKNLDELKTILDNGERDKLDKIINKIINL